MTSFILKRLCQCIVVVIGVTLIAYGLMFLTGDPLVIMYGDALRGFSVEEIEELRHTLGFDRPWIVQYFDYMAGVLQGDFGTSTMYGRSCLTVLLEVWPNTIKLAACALAFTYLLALPLGIASATKRGSFIDRFTMGFALLGQSMPTFWLGLLLIIIFAVHLRILPAGGMDSWLHFVLPTVTMGVFSCARTARLVRSYMLEALSQDYIRTAESKGISRFKVIFKHTLKNVLIPLITMLTMDFGALLGGSVVTESVFAWPGIGRLIVTAINVRDIPLVLSGVMFLSIIFVGLNLICDLLYGIVDPRARVKQKS